MDGLRKTTRQCWLFGVTVLIQAGHTRTQIESVTARAILQDNTISLVIYFTTLAEPVALSQKGAGIV